MDDRDPLSSLAIHLTLMSLLAIGGINTVLPELHRVAVDRQGWLTDGEFTTLFALAQASPGPNLIFVTLIGWKLAGIAGALVATGAITGPAVMLAYGMARVWLAWGQLAWFRVVQRGLAPVTIGLVIASAWLLTVAAASSWRSYAITAATAGIMLTTKTHPIWVLGGAGLIGVLGFA